MRRTAPAVAAVVLCLAGLTADRPARAQQPQTSPREPGLRGTSKELKRLHDEDQADREHGPVDWSVVGRRDRARRTRVKELFAAGALRSGEDYYNAAMVLQHGDSPEDFLLAHELCVVAISLGRTDRQTRWLAAAAEDRFLMNIGRPQRFGTQYRSEGAGPLRLYTVGDGVTDGLRGLMAVPTLAQARAQEAAVRKELSGH